MKTIAIYEAKARFSELLAAVQAGDEVQITRRGEPVARLVAPAASEAEGKTRRKAVAATLERLRALRKGIRFEGDLREAIAQGRD